MKGLNSVMLRMVGRIRIIIIIHLVVATVVELHVCCTKWCNASAYLHVQVLLPHLCFLLLFFIVQLNKVTPVCD